MFTERRGNEWRVDVGFYVNAGDAEEHRTDTESRKNSLVDLSAGY